MPAEDVSQERIGFIGLGVMGEPMSLNLVRAGIARLISAAAAQARTACPLIEACRELFGETAASGLAARDMMAVIKTMEARSARLQSVRLNETLR